MTARTLGRYVLDRKLATGGMAEIWVAHQDGPAGFQKDVVLKKILPHLAEDQKFIDMFLDEARLAAQLTHPNIVQIFDLGEADGEHFLAMEFIDGRDMQAIIDRAVTVDQAFSPAIAARIVADACTALDYAHNFTNREGTHIQLVHRDVSPQNILVSKDGIVKLVDFGVAKAATSTHKTQTGAVKGKLSYMSPEQISGKLVDARSDLFALGIVLYELVTGRRPFGHESELLAITAILNEQPPRPGEVIGSLPAELEQIIFRALEKDPADRFQSASEMQLALEQTLQHMGTILTSREVRSYIEDLYSESPTGTILALAGIPVAPSSGQLTQVEHPSAMTRPEFRGVPRHEASVGGAAEAVREATSASVSATTSNQVYLHGALAQAAGASAAYEEVEPQRQGKAAVVIALIAVLAVLVAGAFALYALFGPSSEVGSTDAGSGEVASGYVGEGDAGSSAAIQDPESETPDARDALPPDAQATETPNGSGDSAPNEWAEPADERSGGPVTDDVGANALDPSANPDTGASPDTGAQAPDAGQAVQPDTGGAALVETTPDVGEAEVEASADAAEAREPDTGAQEPQRDDRPREPRSGTIQVVSPGGSGTIYIDNRRVGSYPGRNRFEVDAGSHTVRVVSSDGSEFSERVRVGGGDTERVRPRF